MCAHDDSDLRVLKYKISATEAKAEREGVLVSCGALIYHPQGVGH